MKITDIIENEYDALTEKKLAEIKQVPKSEIISKLLKLYENFMEIENSDTYGRYQELYVNYGLSDNLNDVLRKTFPFHPWTAKDITEFCFALTPYQEVEEFEYSGIFISELIHQHFADSQLKKGYYLKTNVERKNFGERYFEKDIEKDDEQNIKKNIEKDLEKNIENPLNRKKIQEKNVKEIIVEDRTTYLIPTEHLHKKIDYLGYRLIGEIIIIQGEAGRNCCKEMHAGTVTVTENVGDMLCHQMKGGTVIVEGNTFAGAGWASQGGTLIVKGNAKAPLGFHMEEGFIILEGNITEMTPINSYVNGKIICDKVIKYS